MGSQTTSYRMLRGLSPLPVVVGGISHVRKRQKAPTVSGLLLPKNDLDLDLQEFFVDREARNRAPKTMAWYRDGPGNLGFFPTSEGIPSDPRRHRSS